MQCALLTKLHPDFDSMCILEFMVKWLLPLKIKRDSEMLQENTIPTENIDSRFRHGVSTVEPPLSLQTTGIS